jgi:hypothetical protein
VTVGRLYARNLVAAARRVTVLTGAGVSTDSGVFFGQPWTRQCFARALRRPGGPVVREPIDDALPRLRDAVTRLSG